MCKSNRKARKSLNTSLDVDNIRLSSKNTDTIPLSSKNIDSVCLNANISTQSFQVAGNHMFRPTTVKRKRIPSVTCHRGSNNLLSPNPSTQKGKVNHLNSTSKCSISVDKCYKCGVPTNQLIQEERFSYCTDWFLKRMKSNILKSMYMDKSMIKSMPKTQGKKKRRRYVTSCQPL